MLSTLRYSLALLLSVDSSLGSKAAADRRDRDQQQQAAEMPKRDEEHQSNLGYRKLRKGSENSRAEEHGDIWQQESCIGKHKGEARRKYMNKIGTFRLVVHFLNIRI